MDLLARLVGVAAEGKQVSVTPEDQFGLGPKVAPILNHLRNKCKITRLTKNVWRNADTLPLKENPFLCKYMPA